MTRKITIEAVNAFLNCKSFSKWNTVVTTGKKKYSNWIESDSFSLEYTKIFLHGNEIACRKQNLKTWVVEICITNAWWFSNTTKERLNWLPWVSIVQKKGKWYLNGKEWGWDWIKV
jgi:hypothetical protein